MIENGTVFELTEDHIKLLQSAYVRWEDAEAGAPAIDPKRPYGNSSVELDMAEILGWNQEGDEYPLLLEQEERLNELHRETEIALQIILRHKTFRPGKFIYYDYKWHEYND